MIVWSDHLYFSESVKKKHRRAIFAIKHGRRMSNLYCIAFASNEENLFDILPANELLFPHYKHSEVHILGLANGKQEACELVQDMIIDIYRDTGDFKVRSYFA